MKSVVTRVCLCDVCMCETCVYVYGLSRPMHMRDVYMRIFDVSKCVRYVCVCMFV